jgi:hypothetical protein
MNSIAPPSSSRSDSQQININATLNVDGQELGRVLVKNAVRGRH